jgi:hypothetical protein
LDDILCGNTGDSPPYLFINQLSLCLPILVRDKNEPEGIYYPVVPKKKFQVLVFLCVIHLIKDLKVHAAHAFIIKLKNDIGFLQIN